MGKEVRFRLFRKMGFSGHVLTNFLCINGEPVCALQNGGDADVEVEQAPVYFIHDVHAIEYNCVLPHSSNFYEIELRRTGWKDRDDNGVFYLQKNGEETQLSPFRMDKIREAMEVRRVFESLCESEKVLTRVLEFREAVRDGADRVLCDPQGEEMLRAVLRIGAKQYTAAFGELLGTLFAGESLPLNAVPLEAREDASIREAVERIRQAEQNGDAEKELDRCIATFILKQFLYKACDGPRT